MRITGVLQWGEGIQNTPNLLYVIYGRPHCSRAPLFDIFSRSKTHVVTNTNHGSVGEELDANILQSLF